MAGEDSIQVKPAHNLVFSKAWGGRSRGFWGVAALGLALGAAVGAIAPFFPMVVTHSLPAWDTIGNSIAI